MASNDDDEVRAMDLSEFPSRNLVWEVYCDGIAVRLEVRLDEGALERSDSYSHI